jgi:predicted nucleotidyltransferase
MFTVKKLHNHINNFLLELKEKDFYVRKVILFGSYANGNVNENSDIDLAIWADEFDTQQDNLEKIKSLVAKYYPHSLYN